MDIDRYFFRTREKRQKLALEDKRQRKEWAERLLRCLRDGVGPNIFDECKIELHPYLNSTKNRYS